MLFILEVPKIRELGGIIVGLPHLLIYLVVVQHLPPAIELHTIPLLSQLTMQISQFARTRIVP